MKLILVVNTGSSSLKFKLFSFPDKVVLSEGQVEKLGSEHSLFKLRFANGSIEKDIGKCNHEKAFSFITNGLIDNAVIANLSDIEVVGHRVVHGGVAFNQPVIIDENVKETIRSLFFLAPLHNPANLTGIISAEKTFRNAVQIAVFDTAFHATIPDHARRYAIPKDYYTKHQIRIYGFHGTSHRYISQKYNEIVGTKDTKIITLHLGNGCSMAAIKDGECIDTSLGFSPTGGLIMGTRSGDIDPMIIPYLMEKLNMPISEITDMLNKKSGLLGISGKSDLREIIQGAESGNTDDKLALMMSAYRIRKYIGAYAAAMNGLDALVFTAGIGENSAFFRALVLEELEYFGVSLDSIKNEKGNKDYFSIHSTDSRVEILVIPTNEELEIAQQAHKLIS